MQRREASKIDPIEVISLKKLKEIDLHVQGELYGKRIKEIKDERK